MSKRRKIITWGGVLLLLAAVLSLQQAPLNGKPVRFQDASHLLNHGTWSSYVDSMLASGVCVLDANGDGWQDIFIPGPGTQNAGEPYYMESPKLGNRLFLNRGLDDKGFPVFKDVSEQAGVANLGKTGVGCAAADVDNDGMEEIIIANATKGVLFSEYGLLADPVQDRRVFPPPFFVTDGTDGKYEFPEEGGVTLFYNQGNDGEGIPRFADRTIEAGLTKGGNGAAVAIGDID
ncbi:MAG: VCBS repeat-containing protein, partial [bacterium]|nr:VCBS repeat-containing protein [bacterium]